MSELKNLEILTDEGKKAFWMREALKEARKAYRKGEIPVGAVIVYENRIIARGHNEREDKQDATLHAEMIAIRKACKKLGTWRLTGCTLFVTLEPCPMCAGAAIQSRIDRICFGTADPKGGAAGSVLNLLGYDRFNHKVELESGILQYECAQILKDFFRQLRSEQKGYTEV